MGLGFRVSEPQAARPETLCVSKNIGKLTSSGSVSGDHSPSEPKP